MSSPRDVSLIERFIMNTTTSNTFFANATTKTITTHFAAGWCDVKVKLHSEGVLSMRVPSVVDGILEYTEERFFNIRDEDAKMGFVTLTDEELFSLPRTGLSAGNMSTPEMERVADEHEKLPYLEPIYVDWAEFKALEPDDEDLYFW